MKNKNEVKVPDNGEIVKNKTEESLNLGLDADHSSDDSRRYDNDNDRISHNPDGEDDDRDTQERSGSSPLMDK